MASPRTHTTFIKSTSNSPHSSPLAPVPSPPPPLPSSPFCSSPPRSLLSLLTSPFSLPLCFLSLSPPSPPLGSSPFPPLLSVPPIPFLSPPPYQNTSLFAPSPPLPLLLPLALSLTYFLALPSFLPFPFSLVSSPCPSSPASLLSPPFFPSPLLSPPPPFPDPSLHAPSPLPPLSPLPPSPSPSLPTPSPPRAPFPSPPPLPLSLLSPPPPHPEPTFPQPARSCLRSYINFSEVYIAYLPSKQVLLCYLHSLCFLSFFHSICKSPGVHTLPVIYTLYSFPPPILRQMHRTPCNSRVHMRRWPTRVVLLSPSITALGIL